ncbi:hypothetical protein H4219_004916 [Mycoemilia scoparia]|uniref:C2H2-type domain-containing protein n=1 Tax=Mycoemilia scoparia TaxID=417184 RepID=A0A9W7ZZL0_9FUNG|nr:hypothetical protein H4219_004916 [Mycoemilia scoparia]
MALPVAKATNSSPKPQSSSISSCFPTTPASASLVTISPSSIHKKDTLYSGNYQNPSNYTLGRIAISTTSQSSDQPNNKDISNNGPITPIASPAEIHPAATTLEKLQNKPSSQMRDMGLSALINEQPVSPPPPSNSGLSQRHTAGNAVESGRPDHSSAIQTKTSPHKLQYQYHHNQPKESTNFQKSHMNKIESLVTSDNSPRGIKREAPEEVFPQGLRYRDGGSAGGSHDPHNTATTSKPHSSQNTSPTTSAPLPGSGRINSNEMYSSPHNSGTSDDGNSGEDGGKSNGSRNVDKPYACDQCDLTFSRQHNLKSHALTHSTERPFLCSVCKVPFRRQHDLKRHMKLHTGEKPHTCTNCGRSFARLDALHRHMRAENFHACNQVAKRAKLGAGRPGSGVDPSGLGLHQHGGGSIGEQRRASMVVHPTHPINPGHTQWSHWNHHRPSLAADEVMNRRMQQHFGTGDRPDPAIDASNSTSSGYTTYPPHPHGGEEYNKGMPAKPPHQPQVSPHGQIGAQHHTHSHTLSQPHFSGSAVVPVGQPPLHSPHPVTNASLIHPSKNPSGPLMDQVATYSSGSTVTPSTAYGNSHTISQPGTPPRIATLYLPPPNRRHSLATPSNLERYRMQEITTATTPTSYQPTLPHLTDMSPPPHTPRSSTAMTYGDDHVKSGKPPVLTTSLSGGHHLDSIKDTFAVSKPSAAHHYLQASEHPASRRNSVMALTNPTDEEVPISPPPKTSISFDQLARLESENRSLRDRVSRMEAQLSELSHYKSRAQLMENRVKELEIEKSLLKSLLMEGGDRNARTPAAAAAALASPNDIRSPTSMQASFNQRRPTLNEASLDLSSYRLSGSNPPTPDHR